MVDGAEPWRSEQEAVRGRPHRTARGRGCFLGSNRARTSPTWSASRGAAFPAVARRPPRPRFTLPLPRWACVVVEAGCVARGRAALRPASCEPRHGTRPMGDSRAVGSEGKGRSHVELKFLSQVMVEPAPGEDCHDQKTISELLMLTCYGAFIASVTYAVKLSIEAF